jgi:hypothetical protein
MRLSVQETAEVFFYVVSQSRWTGWKCGGINAAAKAVSSLAPIPRSGFQASIERCMKQKWLNKGDEQANNRPFVILPDIGEQSPIDRRVATK